MVSGRNEYEAQSEVTLGKALRFGPPNSERKEKEQWLLFRDNVLDLRERTEDDEDEKSAAMGSG